MKDNARLLTTEEAAELMLVAPGTLVVWRCTGRYSLAYVRVGRLIRYRAADIAEFIERQRVSPGRKPRPTA